MASKDTQNQEGKQQVKQEASTKVNALGRPQRAAYHVPLRDPFPCGHSIPLSLRLADQMDRAIEGPVVIIVAGNEKRPFGIHACLLPNSNSYKQAVGIDGLSREWTKPGVDQSA
jgi:hypothetical protein